MGNYNATREMVESDSLRQRVTASAADKGIVAPEQWARDMMWFLASDEQWTASWAYAKDSQTLDHNPDTGARPGVINDAEIDRVVQERIDYLKSIEPAPPE